MPNYATKHLQNDLVNIMITMRALSIECKAIYDLYWKTDVTTQISGKGDTDAVAVEADLEKQQLTNGITFCEDLNDFFHNSGVTTTDYLASLLKIIYDDAELVTALSEATEQCCNRLKQLAIDVVAAYEESKLILEEYFDNEISDTIAVLDTERLLYGTDIPAGEISAAIVLLQQFQNMLGNSAVTTGDYSATVAKYSRYDII